MSIAAEIFSEQDWSENHREALIYRLTDEVLESYFDELENQFESDLGEFNEYCGDDLPMLEFTWEPFKSYTIQGFPLRKELNLVTEFFFLEYHIKGLAEPKVLGNTDDFEQEWLNELCFAVIDSPDFFMEGSSELYHLSKSWDLIYEILSIEESDLSREYEEYNLMTSSKMKQNISKALA